ncbi:hypothetical protein JW766_01085 [Candidatus Dojkabacteria bacterium]|nr:hypothetical protein [Candidatus Dojkabacteria bacterium]
MIGKKINYILSKFWQGVVRRYSSVSINWGYVIFTSICILSIILLSINIFRIIRKGYERYEIILEEKERLEKLFEKNAELREELKYYSSKEYIDLKAREELNLAFPNQKLVYIEKQKELNSEGEEKVREEELKPGWRLWYDLIFS